MGEAERAAGGMATGVLKLVERRRGACARGGSHHFWTGLEEEGRLRGRVARGGDSIGRSRALPCRTGCREQGWVGGGTGTGERTYIVIVIVVGVYTVLECV